MKYADRETDMLPLSNISFMHDLKIYIYVSVHVKWKYSCQSRSVCFILFLSKGASQKKVGKAKSKSLGDGILVNIAMCISLRTTQIITHYFL
jgi:hypothetical protein